MDTTFDVASIALGLGARVTALLGLTLLGLVVMRKASAATRHLLAVSGLLGALALPVLSLVLPQWELPVLPAARAKAIQPKPVLNFNFAPAVRKDQPVFANARLAPVIRPVGGAAVDAAPQAALFESLPDAAWEPTPDHIGPARALRYALAGWVIGGWALVAGLILLRIGAGMVRLARLSREAAPSDDAAWLLEVSRCSAELRLRRVVRLLHSDEATMPMTSGALDPVVLMPAAAHGWTQERRRLVLLHELAHVKRLDWVLLVLCEIAAALFWFHPLAWVSLRAARREAENATDDLVLATGARPSVYAGHLVDLLRTLRASPLATSAVPMARAADLEARLRALLGRRGRGPSSLLGRGLAVGLTALAVMFAVVRPTQAAVTGHDDVIVLRDHHHETDEVDADDDQADDEDAHREQAREKVRKLRDSIQKSVRAQVVGPIVKLAKRSKQVFLERRTDLYGQGMEAHNDGRYQEAIELFEKAIRAGQREDAAAYNIACGYARLGQADRAFEWLGKAQKAGFELGHYLEHDGDLRSLRRDPRLRALKAEVQADERDSDSAEARRAIARFDRLVAQNAPSGDAWYAVGKELLSAKEYAHAARAFQQSAARSHRPGASLYNTACALSLGGDKGSAMEFLAKAIDAGFDDLHLLETDDDLDNIRDDRRFADLIENARELAMPSVGYGVAKWLFGAKGEHDEEWREAEGRYQAYARAHPDSGRAAYSLGFARLAVGDNEGAAKAFARAVELGYRRSDSLYNLACAEAKQDHKDQAFRWLDQAIEAGYDSASHLRSDEDLDNLRGDPRYRAAIRKADERARKVESAND